MWRAAGDIILSAYVNKSVSWESVAVTELYGSVWRAAGDIIVGVNVCLLAGNQLPSPSYTAEKTEQTQQLPLSMDQLLGTSTSL